MRNTLFKNSRLTESDFTGADITGGVFDRCDLSGAKFENTILEKVDLRTSEHYSIRPEMNKIKHARFSLNGIAGLLDQYQIDIDPN
jgi:uncharacterized protein YjbI with pentapeptide repeats